MTFNNATCASLGVTPGLYHWTYSDGFFWEQYNLCSGAGCPMAAQQFLCSVSLWSAWLRCGIS
jgi:hypothetical protein